MGHYHHMYYTLVLENPSEDIIDIFDIMEDFFYYDKYVNPTIEKTVKRGEKLYQKIDEFIDKVLQRPDDDIIREYIETHYTDWDDLFLYESNSFEFIAQGIEFPSGFEPSGIYVFHGNCDMNSRKMKAFKDFLEILKPYVKSGSVWGFWESDGSALEVFL